MQFNNSKTFKIYSFLIKVNKNILIFYSLIAFIYAFIFIQISKTFIDRNFFIKTNYIREEEAPETHPYKYLTFQDIVNKIKEKKTNGRNLDFKKDFEVPLMKYIKDSLFCLNFSLEEEIFSKLSTKKMEKLGLKINETALANQFIEVISMFIDSDPNLDLLDIADFLTNFFTNEKELLVFKNFLTIQLNEISSKNPCFYIFQSTKKSKFPIDTSKVIELITEKLISTKKLISTEIFETLKKEVQEEKERQKQMETMQLSPEEREIEELFGYMTLNFLKQSPEKRTLENLENFLNKIFSNNTNNFSEEIMDLLTFSKETIISAFCKFFDKFNFISDPTDYVNNKEKKSDFVLAQQNLNNFFDLNFTESNFIEKYKINSTRLTADILNQHLKNWKNAKKQANIQEDID